MSKSKTFLLICICLLVAIFINQRQVTEQIATKRPTANQVTSSSDTQNSSELILNNETNKVDFPNEASEPHFEGDNLSSIHLITMAKENVPEPFMVADRNVHITFEDFLAIQELYEEYGSPIRYKRATTDELLPGEWWVEHKGYNEVGEPLFELTDMNSFSEKSYQIMEENYHQDLNELEGDESYGDYELELENFARDRLSAFDLDTESAVCRTTKCMFKIRNSNSTGFDITSFVDSIQARMQKANPDKYCSKNWRSLLPSGNIIYLSCISN